MVVRSLLPPSRTELLTRLSCAAVFMVPGIALWVRSGYSWGAALLLLCSLFTAGVWMRRPPGREAWWLFASMVCMGAVWALDFNAEIGMGTLDRSSKYLLALPCLFYLLAYPPRAEWLWRGVALGAVGAGCIGIYQTLSAEHGWYRAPWPYFPRAAGYTNPIQYGGISLLLALMASAALLTLWERWRPWQRVGWAVAILMGVEGALLSESRGSWIVLPLALPVCAWLQARCGQRRMAVAGAALIIVGAGALMSFKADEVRTRVNQARQEVTQYEASGDAANSVGQRLAHWKLAWQMGTDRPFFGWGRYGYEVEKQRRVDAGLAHPYVLQFSHAHNEALDLFAKRGLMGVCALALFYGVPLALFWPTRRRVLQPDGQPDCEGLALRIMGVLVPLSYAGFGTTQVFLGHNSGTMFYLFMNMAVLAILQGRERSARARA
ncbi:O-antigen ligase family protein [Acidovorax sp. GBBC 3334]|uniref:O-antigen ligase family protein n=1 Tax=unclassified Acidovorax TaxID=2684926 RepID=UPI002303B4C5|nr:MULTISPECIES: O-antigen ligase family protein [unclassified Acidovorax]MDA8455878.1 O-antigen ligase family protein [Acidovorax sp. GBBC 3334]MDA8523059.1 O-antigen ligase family protein [Acidovorax sp. NCPPB 4044]